MKTRALERFLEWKGWSYDELYKRYFDASRSGDPRDLALMNTGLVLWYKELRKRGLSTGTARNHVKSRPVDRQV